MKYTLAAYAIVLATGVVAEDHHVQIGPGLTYTPDTIVAAEGDTVSVTWGSGHDLTQGSFDNPCQPMDGGIYSGIAQPGQTFTFMVNDTNPLWLYCSVGMHCESGMAMVVNPTEEKTLDMYKQAASSVESSSAPEGGAVSGGSFDASTATESGNTSSTDSSASATSSESADAGSNLVVNLGLTGGMVAGAFALLL